MRFPILTFALLLAAVAAPRAQELPSPEQALGRAVGADGFLADYSQLTDYWRTLAERSARMRLVDIGRTGYGQTQWMAVITSPENQAELDRHRDTNVRLALGRDADEATARALCESGRAVVWIDAGMHATESIAAQNILELVWQMVSREDAEVRRILDEVILLVCPANPDGMEMIAKAYMATGRVGGLPVLYQRYVGHDNNRDFYAGNTAESRNVMGQLYREWLPQVVYNHHQSAPRGTVIFTPPFRDPFNYNIDPLVIRGIELVSAHMNHRFAAEAKPGVISRSGASYSTWWNGGLRTTVYFHNQIGILTEVFGRPDPTPLRQTVSRRLPYSDYPDPVPTQTWHARQTIDYLQTANFALLDLVARYPDEFQLNAWKMARRSIERGSRDHWTPTPRMVEIARERESARRSADESEPDEGEIPDAFEDPTLRDARHYVLPIDQPDFAAATRLVRRLRRAGVEVHRLTDDTFLPAGGSVRSGSFVIHAAQAFRSHVRDMLEPQWHPDDRSSDGGQPVRPYDSAGWTLSEQMGVRVLRVLDGVELPTAPVAEVEVPFTGGIVASGDAGWLLDPGDSNHFIAVNRLHAAGVEVRELTEAAEIGGRRWPAGAIHVPAAEGVARRIGGFGIELGVRAVAIGQPPEVATRRLEPVRVGLFDVYGGHMGTGWTQWALETFEFPVELVFGDRVERGDLAADYDVLIFHTGLPTATERGRRDAALQRGRDAATGETTDKLRAALPPFEDWSTIDARRVRLTEERAIPALRDFVAGGGRLIAMAGQADRLARHFDLPIQEGVTVADENGAERPARSDEFFVPGSLLRLHVAEGDPLTAGVAPRQAVMFRRDEVFTVTDPERVDVLAHYADAGELLASGWAIGAERLRGKAAVLRARIGRGDVVLFGPDVIYRGQPVGTFKFLFRAIQSMPRAD